MCLTMLSSQSPKGGQTNARNGLKAICRVSNVLCSPSPDPTRSPNQRGTSPNGMFRSLAAMAILLCVSACANSASRVSLPFVSPINELDAPKVRWSLPTQDCDYSSLTLVDPRTEAVLGRVKSLFNKDWVASMGKPDGDSLMTFRSATNRTIFVHECASESSLNEHLVIFTQSAEGGWTVRSAFPPYQPPKPPMVYGHYGVSRGIDDDHLYYQFPDGELRRIHFSELQPRQIQPEE